MFERRVNRADGTGPLCPVAVPEKTVGALPRRNLGFFDRCHSSPFLHPPPAAVGLVPSSIRFRIISAWHGCHADDCTIFF